MKGIQSNGFMPIIAQVIAEMEEGFGEFKSKDEINLAELSRLHIAVFPGQQGRNTRPVRAIIGGQPAA